MALIQRFYDPLGGEVLLDGHNIKTLDIQWLRSLFGVVQQETTLFNVSISDNIAYGDNSREVTPDEIEAAARRANIHDKIMQFPDVCSQPFYILLQILPFRGTIPCVVLKVVNYLVGKDREVERLNGTNN